MIKTIDRRTMLKSTGVALTLPMLESMNRNGSVLPPPQRLVFLCTTLGLHPPNLWPKTPGKDYEATAYLKILQDHRNDFTLFSGLQHEDQTGRQPHDSEMTFLTSARKPGMGGFRNSVSIDQIAATQLKNKTRFSSITLGSAKSQSQSYTAGGVMIPAQTNPAKLFESLFMKGPPKEIESQKRRLNQGKSILDQLSAQAKSLQQKASQADNHLLDDYLQSVREAETNIGNFQSWIDKPKPQVETEKPKNISDIADIIGRTRLLMNLIPLIIQTDSSRVVSLMIQDHFAVPKIKGVTGNHHNLSHHGQDRTKILQLQKIETAILHSFGDLLHQMKSRTETGSSLLKNTSVLFGSNLGNANAHQASNLPIFLAGGKFKHGQYIAKSKGTPLSNLFVSMLNQNGIESDHFGQSTGTLSW